MRVCFINPPRIQPKAWGKPNVFPPITMASVAAVLEKKGHKVSIIDSPTEGWENLEELDATKYRVGLNAEVIARRITELNSNAVIVEIPFSGWSKTAFEVISIAKKINEDITVIVFGLHASSRPEACLEDSEADFVVVGEPEITILELIQTIQNKKTNFKSINGLAFRENSQVVLTAKRAFIEDLDTLPFPARHLLPMKVYAEAVKQNPLRGEITKPYTIVITSRGCPFNCVFCTHCIVWGKVWRPRSPKNVVDEVEHVIKTYGIKQIDFADDNMTWNRERMMKICDLIVERGLRFEWFTPNGVRADTLDDELLRKMSKAGCKKIRVAPESGVQRVVTNIAKKSLDLKKVEDAVVAARKVGIRVGCFFVIGLIGETKADIEETIHYAYKLKSLGAESFIFSIAMPLYGTEFYAQAKAGGYIRNGFCDYSLAATEPLVETPEWSAEELNELCIKANAINRSLTRKKVAKAMQHPVKTAKLLFGVK
jgi:anaerobic magnesium-protoporphyrin IX monomethyl ester cyclase